jgi:hypothetical protein
VSGRLRTYDLRLWVTVDPPGPALAAFFAEVRELVEAHPGIEVRWIGERRDLQGGPRMRVDLSPRDDAGETPAGRSTR